MRSTAALGARHGHAVLAAATPAAAQSPEDFYRGKTVNLLIGTQPGGAYARLLGRHRDDVFAFRCWTIIGPWTGSEFSTACAHRTFEMVALTCRAHFRRLGGSSATEIVIGSGTRL
jgi:hypothetical protein